jgi:branched-chain amino acid transport system ATP-binding protein
MGSAVLEASGVSKQFGGIKALQDVDVVLGEGEILGLIGPNGAGKSVLLQCLSGELRPDTGVIRLRGEDVTNWPPYRRCHAGIGRTFQIPKPFSSLTVLETVLVGAEFGHRRHGRSAVEMARAALELAEVEYDESTPVRRLNAVDLKRLDLARALAASPAVLFLDELAAGLMTGQLNSLVDVIRGIRDRGTSILIVEHVVAALFGLCDRVFVLDHGVKIADGDVREVAADEAVIGAYLGRPLTKEM